jgi:hypothetical protein
MSGSSPRSSFSRAKTCELLAVAVGADQLDLVPVGGEARSAGRDDRAEHGEPRRDGM